MAQNKKTKNESDAKTPLHFLQDQRGLLSCDADGIRVGGQAVDSVIRTFQQDMHGTISTLPNASAYCQAGQLFCITVLRGDFFQAGNIPRTYQETVSARIIRILDPAGTIATPFNRKLGSPNTITIIARLPGGGVFSNGLYLCNFPTGEFNISFQGQIIVPPGYNIIFAVNSLSNTDIGTLSTTITWFEL